MSGDGVRFTSKALSDLRSIFDHIANQLCDLLADAPRIGSPLPELGPEVRRAAFERAVTIVYRVQAGTVLIIGMALRGLPRPLR